MIKAWMVLAALVFSYSSWGVTCYFTLAKDSCWTNYNVTIDVTDARTAKTLTTVTIPSGTQWKRQTFSCEPAQKLMYIARFNPIFWQSDEGKTYSAQNYWSLPDALNPGDTAWTLSVCYPADFSLVPLPPGADGNCACDFKKIPPVKPA